MPRQPSKRAVLFFEYVALMQAAERAALALADVLEGYLRHYEGKKSWRYFDAACNAAAAYTLAIGAAAPWHFGVIRGFTTGHVINCNADEILAMVRELRGSAVPRTVVGSDGRKVCAFIYEDDGIAGFFRGEVRAMRRFRSPRRVPEDRRPPRSARAVQAAARVQKALERGAILTVDAPRWHLSAGPYTPATGARGCAVYAYGRPTHIPPASEFTGEDAPVRAAWAVIDACGASRAYQAARAAERRLAAA
jgi:hypothetical protein